MELYLYNYLNKMMIMNKVAKYLLKLQLIPTLVHWNRWRCTVWFPPPAPAATIDGDSATPAAEERRGAGLFSAGGGGSMAAEIEERHSAACVSISR